MANAIYPKAKQRALTSGMNLSAGTVKAVLIDTASYTYSASHEFLSSIPVGARVGAAVTLAGKTVTDGVFDCDDFAFTGLVAAPGIEAIGVFVEVGSDATSPLIAYIDTATGLPAAAGATEVSVAVDSGANKLFKL